MNYSRGVLSVSFFHDIPRAYIFQYRNGTYLRGPYAETVKYFAQYRNFDLHFKIFNDIHGVAEIFSDIENGKFNISTYSATYNVATPSKSSASLPWGISYSYPLERNKKCIMVPHSQDLPRFLYFLWPFDLYNWLCVMLGICYISVLMHFVSWASSAQKNACSFVRNLSHAFNITFFAYNMGPRVKQASLRVTIFYALLYLYGFIISTYHLAHLTSFCMKPLFMKPIDSMQDILSAKLTIIGKRTSFNELERSGDPMWRLLRPLTLNVTGARYQSLLRDFNRHYAYIVSLDQWDFISRQQQFLKKPIFHLTSVCFSAALRALPVQANWTHSELLNIYLMRIQESALWQYWIEKAFIHAMAQGDAQILLDSHPVKALKLDFFLIAWLVVASGGIVGFVVVLIEFAFYSYQRRRKKRNHLRAKTLVELKVNQHHKVEK